jgi:hypothetical protein
MTQRVMAAVRGKSRGTATITGEVWVADEPIVTENYLQDRVQEAKLVAKLLSTPEAKAEMLVIASDCAGRALPPS